MTRSSEEVDSALREQWSARRLCVKWSAKASGSGILGNGCVAKIMVRSVAGLSRLPLYRLLDDGHWPCIH